jgi:hypothetical protein
VNGRFVGSDEDGDFPAKIAASGASDWTERAERAIGQSERSERLDRASANERSNQARLQFERAQPPS